MGHRQPVLALRTALARPPSPDRLRLTVKDLGDTSRLLQSIEIGTWVIAEGAYGAMTATRRTRRGVLLVAGGVGITSMRALFEWIPTDPGQELILLFRVGDRANMVFRSELDAIAVARRARMIYLHGDDRGLPRTPSLQCLVPDRTDRDVYLCDPPGMSEAVRQALLTAGLPESRLYEERFVC